MLSPYPVRQPSDHKSSASPSQGVQISKSYSSPFLPCIRLCGEVALDRTTPCFPRTLIVIVRNRIWSHAGRSEGSSLYVRFHHMVRNTHDDLLYPLSIQHLAVVATLVVVLTPHLSLEKDLSPFGNTVMRGYERHSISTKRASSPFHYPFSPLTSHNDPRQTQPNERNRLDARRQTLRDGRPSATDHPRRSAKRDIHQCPPKHRRGGP